jgi:hypothetical protein
MVASADNNEPDGDFSTATEIEPGSYSAELVGEDDDYYRVPAEEGDTVQIVVEVDKDDDNTEPNVELTNSQGENIEFAAERTTPVQSTIRYVMYHEVQQEDLVGGQYLFVRASSYDEDDTDSYTLEFRRNANDQYEPNSGVQSATPIEPGTYSGVLLDAESDYYAIDLAAGETINATMTVSKKADGSDPDNFPWLELADGSDERLDRATERTSAVRDTIDYDLKYEAETAGTYYLHAYGGGDNDVKTEYTLNVDRGANDRYESNGNLDSATPLSSGTYENLTMLDDENDYYAVDVSEGDTLAVNMSVPKADDGERPENYPFLDLVDESGNKLDDADVRGRDAQGSTDHILKYEADSTGTVYLRAFGNSDADVETDYTLSVAQNDNDRYEPNGNISTATPLSPGSYGNLTLLDVESDYYAVNVSAADTLNVTMTVPKVGDGYEADNDPDLTLLDADGDELDEGDYRTTDARDTIDYVMKYEADATGPVYIHAHGDVDAEVETEYTLNVDRNENDRYEPNGNVSAATPLSPGTYENLTLLDVESDYYEIEAAAGDTLNVTMTVPKVGDGYEADNDPELELVDGNGDWLDEGDYRTTDTRDTIDYVLRYELESSGPVYLRAYGDSGGEIETDYALSVRRNDNDRYEPNGNLDSATPLSPGTYDDLTLLDEENDYYAVTVEDGGTLSATMDVRKAADGNEPNNDPDLDLIDADGNAIEYDDTTTEPAWETVRHTLDYTADGEQTVYVRPHGTDDAEAIARYNLSLSGEIQKPSELVNEPPTASSQDVVTRENTSATEAFAVSDPDDDSLLYSIDSHPEHGILSVSDGSFTYTPDTGYNGTDSFTYAVRDGNGGRDTATVQITVRESSGTSVDVTGNGQSATDPDGDGAYEDVNGDGTFDVVDVNALYQHRDSSAVQNNPLLFDFDGDGQFGLADVTALFEMVRG